MPIGAPVPEIMDGSCRKTIIITNDEHHSRKLRMAVVVKIIINDSDITQAIGCRFPTVVTRVRSQTRWSGMSGG
jgi:hypothetical protein